MEGEEEAGEEVRDETVFAGPPSARGRGGRSRRRFSAADRPPVPRPPLVRRPVAPPPPSDRYAGPQAARRRAPTRPRPRRPGTPPRPGATAARCHTRRAASAGGHPLQSHGPPAGVAYVERGFPWRE